MEQIKKARMISNVDGVKEISFETQLINTDVNIISVKVNSEDGILCNKEIVDMDAGNHIAEALDSLLGMSVPVGTKFHIKIDFTLPEND